MKVSLVTVVPDLYKPFLSLSLLGKAVEKGVCSFTIKSFMDYVKPKERIDTPTCGPTAGMVIRPEVVQRAVESAETTYGPAFKIFFSPHGRLLNQQRLQKIYARMQLEDVAHILLIVGRYEGMDARVEEVYADELLSVGNFVLMGGDLPAMMFLEAFARLIPGVVGRQESVEQDSFSGPLLDYPEYSLPVEWKGLRVPDIVKSGNHGAITTWRYEKAIVRTVFNHFDWLRLFELKASQKQKIIQTIPPHYVALMHTDVLIGKEQLPGNTSVTSIDVHDIARSSCTYGVQQFFVVTPLKDQQAIVGQFLYFWQEGRGITYNENRHQALELVKVVSLLDDAIQIIRDKHHKDPLIMVTSAKTMDVTKIISYHDQTEVWKKERPVLLVFGTGQGLSPSLIEKADYGLIPIEGFTEYKHLSVRSAAAIILDRWLGVQKKYIKD
ncbi:MAG TPA: tRNA (guanosine(37)-N1)-methyltransferase TrmD [Patescibacteria group bacterium]|nr:tRNA (guanosine(37)-N1)-methyltransferase TrmD [Patescibacteria group bacterium]